MNTVTEQLLRDRRTALRYVDDLVAQLNARDRLAITWTDGLECAELLGASEFRDDDDALDWLEQRAGDNRRAQGAA